MKIVLFAVGRLVEFVLPSQVFGTFSFDDKDEEDTKLINIESDNNEWFLYSTSEVKVLDNGNYTHKLKLIIGEFYTLEREGNKYLIYVTGICDDSFNNYKYNNKIKLVIGRGKDSNINYDINYIDNNLVTLSYINNNLTLQKSSNESVYINKRMVREQNTIVKYGDVINYYGLVIVIFNNIILINNPNNKVFVNKLTANIEDFKISVKEDYANYEIKDIDLYNDNDYFFKSPRIRRIIQNKTIKIDGPPSVKDADDVPLIYTLGPMLTMGMTSSVTLINTLTRISSGDTTLKESWSTMLIAVAMLFTTILWPALTKSFNKKQQKKKKIENINKYHTYLEEKKQEIDVESKLQSEILIENLLSNEQCYEMIMNRRTGLWGRRIEQEDFLTTRIGIGNYPTDITINCPDDGFSIEDTSLKKEALQIADSYHLIKNVPIGYSF